MEKKINADIFMPQNIVIEPINNTVESNVKKIEDVISIEHLNKTFNKGEKNEYCLFNDFNFKIPYSEVGQVISIMGGSGCGKSQLLRIIAGLNDIEEGNVKIFGRTIEEYGSIPMVFQMYSNFEWLTVLENVMLPMKVNGVNIKDAKERAMDILKMVGLDEHACKYAKNTVLSGGQLQRVSIARSLACDSDIILLDEATGALDIKMKREVQNIILKVLDESKKTFINVTHSVEEAAYISNKVIILKPKPCTIYKTLDIHYIGENGNLRGQWVFDTPEFTNNTIRLNQYLNEVCNF